MSDEKNNKTQPDAETPKTEIDEQPKVKSVPTELERQNAKRRRDAMIKRKMQQIKDATPEQKEIYYQQVHSKRVEMRPTTFKGKWANYWYHYKVLTWFIVIVIALGGFFIYDIATKKVDDVDIMMATEIQYPFEVLEPIQAELEKLIEDYNDDGEKNVMIQSIVQTKDADQMDPNMFMAQQVKFTTSVSEGMNYIYILDAYTYDFFKENQVELFDLSTVISNPNVDGEKYNLKDNPLFKDLQGKTMQGDEVELMLVIRDVDGIRKGKEEAKQARFDRELELVKKIIDAE